jgi:hypothetical protein
VRFTIWVAMLVMVPHAAAAQAPTYTATFLGPANHVEAMNESGHVVGWVTSGDSRAFVAGPGRPYLLLPLPVGMASSIAHDINEAGVIVGAVAPSYFPDYYLQARAARWTPNGAGGYTVSLLGALPGHVSSMATAANDVGDVVGYSFNGTFRLPVRFGPSGPVDLSATGIFDPADVNNQRIVIDHSASLLRLDLDTLVVEDAGIPAGSFRAVWMQAINDRGTAVGAAIAATGTSCNRHAALHDGTGWQILSSCGPINSAYDVNALDDVLMQLNLTVWVRLSGIGTFRVEDLISTNGGRWLVISSYDNALNDARQIAVLATNEDTGESGAVLLTPRGRRPACGLGAELALLVPLLARIRGRRR